MDFKPIFLYLVGLSASLMMSRGVTINAGIGKMGTGEGRKTRCYSSEGPENREVLIRLLDEILNVFSNDFGR